MRPYDRKKWPSILRCLFHERNNSIHDDLRIIPDETFDHSFPVFPIGIVRRPPLGAVVAVRIPCGDGMVRNEVLVVAKPLGHGKTVRVPTTSFTAIGWVWRADMPLSEMSSLVANVFETLRNAVFLPR